MSPSRCAEHEQVARDILAKDPKSWPDGGRSHSDQSNTSTAEAQRTTVAVCRQAPRRACDLSSTDRSRRPSVPDWTARASTPVSGMLPTRSPAHGPLDDRRDSQLLNDSGEFDTIASSRARSAAYALAYAATQPLPTASLHALQREASAMTCSLVPPVSFRVSTTDFHSTP